jgi:hypothetical protein
MINEDLFIKNIHSKNQDRISVALVYDTLSKEAQEVVGCITKYMKAVLSVFCAIIFQNLMKLTQIN